MTARSRRWIDVAWPLALLVIFLTTFRGSAERRDGDDSIDCESPAALDTATLERCLTFTPRQAAAMTELGDRYAREQDITRAEAMYRRVIAVDPRDGEVRLRLARLLLARGDISGCLAEAEAALVTLPGNREVEDLVAHARESEQ
jgi:predicted Zn-dependent protease